MRSVLGIILVGVGLAMAVAWLPAYDGERQLAVVTEIATQGMARVSVPEPAQPPGEALRANRTFSPQVPLFGETPSRGETVVPAPVPVPRPARSDAARSDPARSDPVITSSVVSTAPSTANIATLTIAGSNPGQTLQAMPRLTSARPADDTHRIELIRNLQRELKRVGCYQGEVDGDWGSGSRRAMSTFTERVNASLPFDEPDYILLTMVQGHAAQACGKTCPAGQSISDGKCVPAAVVAQATRRAHDVQKDSQRKIASREPDTAKIEAGRPEPGKTDTGKTKTETGKTEPIRTASAATEPERRPNSGWTVTVEPSAAVVPGTAIAAAAAALPGRMSVGAAAPLIEPEAPLASQAVRNALPQSDDGRSSDRGNRTTDESTEAKSKPRERSKPRQMAQSSPRPVVVYREPPRYRPPPAYFAPAPRRPSSRAWTANFFERF